MAELSVLEEHTDFASAARRARELAIQFHESTGLQRSSNSWAVLASPSVVSMLVRQEEESIDDVSDYSDPYDDEYQREVLQPLIEEFESDQDAWAQSEEDGWFYED